jgi:dTDP-4-amino-4,6-dideoxygalactose transaminase
VKFKFKFPFLYNDSDYCIDNNDFSYPYPAKMSECFAYLAHISLKNWQETIDRRIANKDKLLSVVEKLNIGIIPKAYSSKNLKIVPLRLAILVNRNSKFFNLFDKLYDRNLMWFISPLACNEEYKEFRIIDSMIPNCIKLNNTIINIPIDNNKEVDKLIKIIENIHG